MNILIIGYGVVGKYYLKYLIKDKRVNKIFVINDIELPKNKNFLKLSLILMI